MQTKDTKNTEVKTYVPMDRVGARKQLDIDLKRVTREYHITLIKLSVSIGAFGLLGLGLVIYLFKWV